MSNYRRARTLQVKARCPRCDEELTDLQVVLDDGFMCYEPDACTSTEEPELAGPFTPEEKKVLRERMEAAAESLLYDEDNGYW